MRELEAIVSRNARGEAAGVWSLCSAHPVVVESAMREAAAAGTALLVEATSNQVNQFGGYTGMRPADFVRMFSEPASPAFRGEFDVRWADGGMHLAGRR